MTTGQKEKSQVNQPSVRASPPQINWGSRPHVRTNNPGVDLHSLVSSESSQHPETVLDATGRRLVAVYVEADRLSELEKILRQLNLPLLFAPCPNPEHPGHYHECPTQIVEGPIICDQSGELEQLTASFSSLSTSEDLDKKPSELFPPRSVFPPDSLLASPGKKRYYSITVGKCTGVYWDTWDNVEILIKHVPNARFKGFTTHAAAAQHYSEAKKALKVKIIRDPGDEKKFGAMCTTLQ